jgi:ATP-dependent helicase/DNAse subunit B
VAPFELVCGAETVRLSGRIDRIDVGVVAGQTVFNIVDYKSGTSVRLSRQAIAEGLALQLPLYALAAEQLLLSDLQAVPWRAAYWYVRDKGYQEAISFYQRSEAKLEIDAEWEELREKLLARVVSLVQAIRRGQFPMHSADKECTGRCPFHTVCRVNQARSAGKSWLPPRVDA